MHPTHPILGEALDSTFTNENRPFRQSSIVGDVHTSAKRFSSISSSLFLKDSAMFGLTRKRHDELTHAILAPETSQTVSLTSAIADKLAQIIYQEEGIASLEQCEEVAVLSAKLESMRGGFKEEENLL